ncbi:toll/interleukin-1 receptor-like protein, partial [Cynara cardunculus var. scolymus]|uniref:toll/interleukin-1 receptor-like protein n=1 Tax=Cynara cardunculus var. scolymus TaxID=59895 RepID=UPI000D629DA3
MASSSASSIPKTSFKYDVFLSFRGEDTRKSFVDHLYEALKKESIETYKDDKNLEKGKKICKELIQAIEESRFHVIVFSKNYASSSWCLDELVVIMECQKKHTKQTLYPIFYDVEPTEVRKQNGAFGEAFAKCKKEDYEGKWRKALEDATSFSGRDLRTTANGHEVEFIKLVVKDISSKLPVVSAVGNLIGMRTQINGVVSSLNAFPDELSMIGIAGMGGLKSLQQQVLRDVLKKQDIFVNGVLEGKKEMKKKMYGIKVLVVLDDVDDVEQLKALAGEPNWFKPRNKEAICLLSRYAFGKESPNPGYEELSRDV